MNKLSPLFWLEEIIGVLGILLFFLVLLFYKLQLNAHNWLADWRNHARRQ